MFKNLLNKVGTFQLVLLGESAHGIMEQNKVRVDLIKTLHKNYGFDFLFIESVKEIESKEKLEKLTAYDYMKSCLHEVYHTEEVLSLIKYAKISGLSIEGFEIEGNDLEQYRKIKKNDERASRTFRDLTMFQNFEKQMNYKLKDKKVIIWGHNAHLMKKTSSGAYRNKVFGEFIFEHYFDRSFSIGQYTGSGEIEHMPNQKRLIESKDGFLEKFIVDHVVDLNVYTKLDEDIFIRPIKNNFCGGETEELVLADHYDALILHYKGSAPNRI